VVIIDGIGPMLAVDDPGRQPNFSRFKMMLDTNLSKVAHVLKQCHTVMGHRRSLPAAAERSAWQNT
ncbi:MAG: hypothetical protein WB691_03630, partial [Pseudolabrys sp.]